MTRYPRSFVWTCLACVLLSCAQPIGSVATETGQHPGKFNGTLQRVVSLDYLLFLPAGYEPNHSQRWPLMVFLHGAGERGTNLQLVARHGPPKRVLNQPDFPYVVLSPQCPEGRIWDVEALNALLDAILDRHAIDPKRVYLTGLSMGGYGSWAWAAAYPERFAAVAPICGGGEPVAVWLAGGARRTALSRLPIWAFHGAKDTVVLPAESQRMIDAFKRLNNDVRLTLYPEAGHDCWTAAYDDPALYEWFSKQRLP